MQRVTLSRPETIRYLNRECVPTLALLGNPDIEALKTPLRPRSACSAPPTAVDGYGGGQVRLLWCDGAGNIRHRLDGFVTAETLLAEGRWAAGDNRSATNDFAARMRAELRTRRDKPAALEIMDFPSAVYADADN